MILFFGSPSDRVFAVQVSRPLEDDDIPKLVWLFGERQQVAQADLTVQFIGPRAAMVTPWSTNAVEITQNMGITDIIRIEQFFPAVDDMAFDPMISQMFDGLDQEIFQIHHAPTAILEIADIRKYNEEEGLALSPEEVTYLEDLAVRLGRPLTDSEVFGFSQVNSEHCRHKIFNGTFIIDGEEKEMSLFKLIKKTTQTHPAGVVSAYKDNVAFIEGPQIKQFAPERVDRPSSYEKKDVDSVISLKAETHNFPTTVEPFSGAATGSGGEIRDRLAGGKGSIPLAGTAVYMTAYSRLTSDNKWEQKIAPRQWLYQTPIDILIKASNGASDFGNKFGQPLIAGSVFTFEHEENEKLTAYDKVIMLAGGIGYGYREQALKDTPSKGDKIVILGGDNYRIGMGGAAVSSADTGAFGSGIELNAVQRSNPEMQKRVANTIRALVESDQNTIVSIHDHGAGGHLNCLSELVEDTGGQIDLDALPVGDPTLSAKEIIGNESQERMGLVIGEEHLNTLEKVAERERSPMYVVGEVTGDHRFSFASEKTADRPMDLALADMFGSSPKTVMEDQSLLPSYAPIRYEPSKLAGYLRDVLRLEAVACKDWLTNKVDRCVGGRVAKQQCAGPLQLPLNNCGVMALDYDTLQGVATSIGHTPASGLIDAAAGARLSITEALTNIMWAPLKDGLKSVSLSANWMWPCRNPGEDARLYSAVEAVSDYAIALGINVPTGKDSLSMKQKYADRQVLSPGTVVISATGHCDDITKVVEPLFDKRSGAIYYIDLSDQARSLGGSSFAQVTSQLGTSCPDIKTTDLVIKTFETIQLMIKDDLLAAGHDISSGGLVTTLLEMCFADNQVGAEIELSHISSPDLLSLLFSEGPGIVIQAKSDEVGLVLQDAGLKYTMIGRVTDGPTLYISYHEEYLQLDVADLRDTWYETSYLLDQQQTAGDLPLERYQNYKKQAHNYVFPDHHTGSLPEINDGPKPKAAILREKGSNSEREMAHAMYLAGWDVRDVHMTDLMSGRETLEDIQFLGAVGGFSNSDVLESAKGWAGAVKYNEKAKQAFDNFFAREDVLSVGICNGCQLFMELDLIYPDHKQKSKMTYNDSGKHESAFTSVNILENNAVMLHNLAGSNLGVWISHGEGKFVLPHDESDYNICAKYTYDAYPSNPNGSDYNAAMVCSADGRHLATMPHIERSIFKWNWAHYPRDRDDLISPWIQAFVNARVWIEKKGA